MRKGFHDPYSNDGHDEGLAGDGLSEWHPAFLPGWGSKLLGRDPSAGSSSSGLGKGGRRPVAPGQQVLPWHGGGLVAALPQDWQQGAEHFRRVNGIRPRPTGPKPEGFGVRWDSEPNQPAMSVGQKKATGV